MLQVMIEYAHSSRRQDDSYECNQKPPAIDAILRTKQETGKGRKGDEKRDLRLRQGKIIPPGRHLSFAPGEYRCVRAAGIRGNSRINRGRFSRVQWSAREIF